ncbi:hypothetical protein ACFQZ2_13475, partial [Streptomonospora algeriensis]
MLEVETGEDAFGGDAARELGRILRYWGGNLHRYDLKPATARTATNRTATTWAAGASSSPAGTDAARAGRSTAAGRAAAVAVSSAARADRC